MSLQSIKTSRSTDCTSYLERLGSPAKPPFCMHETGSKVIAECLSPSHLSSSPRKSAGGQHGNGDLRGLCQRQGTKCCFCHCEVNHAGSVLCRCLDYFLRSHVGLYQGGGSPLRGGSSGIRHCRSHRNLPFYLSAVRAASSRTVLRWRHAVVRNCPNRDLFLDCAGAHEAGRPVYVSRVRGAADIASSPASADRAVDLLGWRHT